MLAGYDAESKGYVNVLKNIYNNYQGYANEYEGDIQPILDAMDEDIGNLSGYLDEYRGTLGEMKPTFMSGIEVEASPAMRRAEYMGGVAGQFDAAEGAMRRDAASQGINPYTNKGARRSMLLKRALAMGGASNQAYDDWREQHNQDVQAKQQGMATYADLESRVPQMYSGVLNARGSMLDAHRGVLDTRLKAQGMKAQGYENLLDRTEDRRSETLQLGAQKSGMDAQVGMARANMQTALAGSNRDQWNWEPI
jgi:hypothetical protein